MSESNDRYAPNHTETAAKIIAGEAVIMNFINGLYYSMSEVGAAVWEGIEAGRSVAEIGAHVVAHYEVSEEQARTDLNELLATLLEARLIVPADGSESSVADLPAPPETRHPYRKPELKQHDDMAELLALDPPMPGLGDTGWKAPEDTS